MGEDRAQFGSLWWYHVVDRQPVPPGVRGRAHSHHPTSRGRQPDGLRAVPHLDRDRFGKPLADGCSLADNSLPVRPLAPVGPSAHPQVLLSPGDDACFVVSNDARRESNAYEVHGHRGHSRHWRVTLTAVATAGPVAAKQRVAIQLGAGRDRVRPHRADARSDPERQRAAPSCCWKSVHRA